MSATNSIAGLKVSEFWYDAKGQTVSGSDFRYRKPLMPNEVVAGLGGEGGAAGAAGAAGRLPEPVGQRR